MFYSEIAAVIAASWAAHFHPPTPAFWEPGACMTVVDRSASPVLAFTYSPPYEDTMVPPEELADSRRHQFFALCHNYSRDIDWAPTWITQADLDRAVDFGLVEAASVVPGDILESSAPWAGCWTRITADDERRPITFAAAAEGVLWDTTGLPVGPQVIYGYTWQPPFNIWAQRDGVVQIVDDLDPAAAPPAVAISSPEIIVFDDEDPAMIEGCVRAMAGSTLTAWFTVRDDEPRSWTVFAAEVPVVGESFAVPLVVSPVVSGAVLAIRVEVVDPLGRRHTTYMKERVNLLHRPPQKPAPGGESGGGESSGGESSGGEASSGGEGTAGEVATEGGCGCVTSTRAPGWGLFGLLLLRRRRGAARAG